MQRRIGAAGEMMFVGNVGDKAFTDGKLPGSAAGALGGVTYAVTAVRGGLRGPVASTSARRLRAAPPLAT